MLEFTLELVRKEPERWERINWYDYAACLETTDPEIFFNENNPNKAKTYCKQCPVLVNCLAFAESLDSEGLRIGAYGVWGGLTSTERKLLRRKL